MSNQLKVILLTLVLLGTALVLQSTLLSHVAIGGVKPDLSLMILTFAAFTAGPLIGEICGFGAGLIEDFMSLSPLGFHALVRTLVGYLLGRLQGSLITGPVVLPVVLVAGATLLQGGFEWLLGSLLGDHVPFLGDSRFWIELAYNSLGAPIIFAVLGRLRLYKLAEKEKAV